MGLARELYENKLPPQSTQEKDLLSNKVIKVLLEYS